MASIHQRRQPKRRLASNRQRLSLFWQRLSLILLAGSTTLGTVAVQALTHRHAGAHGTHPHHQLGAPQPAADLVRVTPEGYRIVVAKRAGRRAEVVPPAASASLLPTADALLRHF